jgi:hypothetical protein
VIRAAPGRQASCNSPGYIEETSCDHLALLEVQILVHVNIPVSGGDDVEMEKCHVRLRRSRVQVREMVQLDGRLYQLFIIL